MGHRWPQRGVSAARPSAVCVGAASTAWPTCWPISSCQMLLTFCGHDNGPDTEEEPPQRLTAALEVNLDLCIRIRNRIRIWSFRKRFQFLYTHLTMTMPFPLALVAKLQQSLHLFESFKLLMRQEQTSFCGIQRRSTLAELDEELQHIH